MNYRRTLLHKERIKKFNFFSWNLFHTRFKLNNAKELPNLKLVVFLTLKYNHFCKCHIGDSTFAFCGIRSWNISPISNPTRVLIRSLRQRKVCLVRQMWLLPLKVLSLSKVRLELHERMKFPIKDSFSRCDQIRKRLYSLFTLTFSLVSCYRKIFQTKC